MSNSIDQQFIEYVVKSLVSNPDAVVVERTIDDRGVLLELTVDPEDLGRVIGKRGATAQSLRTLLRALGTKNEARYNLKIVDNGVDAPAKPASDDSQAATDDNTDDQGVEEVEETAAPVESDMVAKTRAELDELDDLDI
ncbi:KH domain-containing protein [Patescibacteria group bacterium]|nr:MAG: KH domain-containing protein [Patescibacteria group bacterium]